MIIVFWYAAGCLKEIGTYREYEGGLTDLPTKLFHDHCKCCLVTGLKTQQQAEQALEQYEQRKTSPIL